MKKFLKNNIKLVLGITIGLIASVVGVYATGGFDSSDVNFDNTNAGLTINNGDVDNVQDAIDAMYIKLSNACPSGYELVSLGEYALTCKSTSAPICKRATTLHTEECQNGSDSVNYYCYADGYIEGSQKGTTITYGRLGTVGQQPQVGDAFDCDINGDGQYNDLTERFYYVSDYFDTETQQFNTSYATLIYYRNFVDGAVSDDGVTYYGTNSSYDNWHGPRTAIAALPANKANGGTWRNDILKTADRKILSCNAANCTTLSDKTDNGNKTIDQGTTALYAGKAARLLTVPEINAGCGTGVGGTGNLSGVCNFLLEKTLYSSASFGTFGPWLENPNASDATLSWSVHGYTRLVHATNAYNTARGARPAIDVRYADMSY